MKRLYSRTRIEAVGAGSDWFFEKNKALIAQIEPNPTNEKRNLLIEYWDSDEDKEADLAEARPAAGDGGLAALASAFRRLAPMPPASRPQKPIPEPEAAKPAPASGPRGKTIVFVLGERNLWGFVRVEDGGQYLLGHSPQEAKTYDSPGDAHDAISRMLVYDRKTGDTCRKAFYVLQQEDVK